MKKELKILHIEDNPGDVLLVEELLYNNRYFQYFFEDANTLNAALEKLKNNTYDVILIDLGLPDSRGLEGVKKIIDIQPNTPVIVITGSNNELDGQNAVNIGAQGYIEKAQLTDKTIVQSILFSLERIEHLNKIRKSEQELEIKNNKLKEAIDAKDRLITIISHDLRSPLASVTSLLEILSQDFNDLDAEAHIKIINSCFRSAKRTSELVENLLMWARSQSEQIKLNTQEVNLSFLLTDVIESLQSTADLKSILLKNRVVPDTWFFGDRETIATVLRNLISNAIKFTPEGGIISIEKSILSETEIAIHVKDTGVGISDENIQKIFDIGEGYTTAGTNEEKGSGFGMILCKEFVERNKGKLWMESTLGKGSTVSFTLPMPKS